MTSSLLPFLQRSLLSRSSYRTGASALGALHRCRGRPTARTTAGAGAVAVGLTTSRQRPSFFSSSATASSVAAPDPPPIFDKVLIANRGEIVQRIIRTCRDMGIKTVAVYSTADGKAPFVGQADESYCVGTAAASDSYLHVDSVLEAVTKSGASAVHPGYGFLSENCDFAAAVRDVGNAAWLGPNAAAVKTMGDKLESKRLASAAGISIIPGYEGTVESVKHALEICNDVIGYPVLLKAAAGGGGKGMRVCYDDRDVREAYDVAKSEAMSFFSDDRLLLEKYIEEPHHIEFQVMCNRNQQDTNEIDVVVFPERECSIQRRNQKIIEETPSTLLTPATRQAMALQVERLCKAVGYDSAGTVEWLVDKDQQFYFLEMNTRLQVEHPVTESVCGVDLVEAMLTVGAGRGFPASWKDKLDRRTANDIVFPHAGHAIEARIYAEDPLRGFVPSTGPLYPYVEPTTTATTTTTANDKTNTKNFVRLDSGVAAGHVVQPYYDPMLSKCIGYGATSREEAIATLQRALQEYVICGVEHNARIVQDILAHPAFIDGDTPTSFLPTHYPGGWKGVQLTTPQEQVFAVSAAAVTAHIRKRLNQPPLAGGADDDENTTVVVGLDGVFSATKYLVTLPPDDNDEATVTTVDEDGVAVVEGTSEQQRTTITVRDIVHESERCLATLLVDGEIVRVQVLPGQTPAGEVSLQMLGADRKVSVQSVREAALSKFMKPAPTAGSDDNAVRTPMPGTLIRYADAIITGVGDDDDAVTVQEGQELCVVEAMKMQNIIRAPRSGTIRKLCAEPGQSLQNNQVLIELVPLAAAVKEDEADDEEQAKPTDNGGGATQEVA